jgi:hypothetical protein
MIRRFALALCVFAVASGSLLADELRGSIKKIDPDRKCIILTIDDQDRTIEIGKSCPLLESVTVGRRRRASTQLQQIGTGISPLQQGMFVQVSTERRDGIQIATQIQLLDQPSYSSGRRLRR